MTGWLWAGFLLVVLVALALDLGVFHRESRAISTTEAAVWTSIWVTLAIIMTAVVYMLYEWQVLGIGVSSGRSVGGRQAAMEFFTGYFIEKSLSLDNIFVIALIFSYFGVPAELQHRVLFWGILGAIVLRGVMILLGAALVERFGWINYVFGGLLLVTAVKMLVVRHDNLDPDRNVLVRLARRVYPVSRELDGQRFFTIVDGRKAITPLFIVLMVIESSDVLFAVDSIPAIFAITSDPFLVFTSNILAILGLRSLYFLLAGVLDRFRYLKMSLVFVLAYVGAKLMLAHVHPIPTVVSLGIIGVILFVGVVASLIEADRDTAPLKGPPLPETTSSHRPPTAGRLMLTLPLAAATLTVVAVVVFRKDACFVVPAGISLLGAEWLWAWHILKRSRSRRG